MLPPSGVMSQLQISHTLFSARRGPFPVKNAVGHPQSPQRLLPDPINFSKNLAIISLASIVPDRPVGLTFIYKEK